MTRLKEDDSRAYREDKKTVKCVVWDLDNTLWEGTLLEDEKVCLRDDVVGIIKELDGRGILQSVASKNDYGLAIKKLEEFNLREYFLYPQINWNSKVSSIAEIARLLNIGVDTVAFIDDQPFERGEVAFSLPQVRCIAAEALGGLLDLPEMTPRFITEDSRARREMYQCDMKRTRAEEEFSGPKEEFLATLNMTFTIAPAGEEDLKRAEELTVRTNQLNSTGCPYSYQELDQFRQSGSHKLFIASLEDKYGAYGKIGLALVECLTGTWTIKLLLMSCRVMSKGVGTIMLNHIMRLAKDAGSRLCAEFVSNDRNRMMFVAFKFAGFKEIDRRESVSLLESDLSRIQPFPNYVKVITTD
ncbi:MAG TPA: HAD-IIIC family phosphatase [Blastocatellia bacterium]|jgi:FkbH-like protein